MAEVADGPHDNRKARMSQDRINADKPHLWKADIAASVDQFNQWFMRFAPLAFRSTRVKTTEHVKAALLATRDLRSLDVATLKSNPNALSTLRMCTAPPLAVDRLIGLANASKNLVGRMEEGRLPKKLKDQDLDAELSKLCRILVKLLDRDIFPWLDVAKAPTDHERDRAATIVADRLCSAVASDSVCSERKIQQLSVLSVYLDSRGYREIVDPGRRHYNKSEPGTYIFCVTVPAAMGRDALLAIDAVVQPIEPHIDGLPVLIQVASHSSFAEAMRHKSAHHATARALRMTYDDDVAFVLMLGGYLGGDYLGTQAAEGIDWVWQHRLSDLDRVLS
jgi:hypothetical protein